MKRKLLTTACAMLAFAGSSYAQTDGEYYLYDAATQTFLTRGANYGSRAVTNKYGMLVTWNSSEGTLTFKDSRLRLFVTGANDIYTDNTSNSTGWQFVSIDDGVDRSGYVLQYGTEGKYVGRLQAGSEILAFVNTLEEAVVWQFKTRDEYNTFAAQYVTDNYKSIISSAGVSVAADKFVETLDNPSIFAKKDVTGSIGTATFNGNIGSWKWTETRNQGNQPAYGTNFAEVWQAAGSYTQSITVPQGIYKVTMQGFERNGSFDDCNTLGEAGYQLTTATLEANDAAVLLKPWYSERTGTNDPNDTGQAVAKFNAGKYLNELYTYVGEDGQLNLKVNIPSFVGDRWVIFNNFTLTYYTDKVSEEEASNLLASVPAGKMNSAVATELTTAKETFEANKTISNYNALTSAIQKANTSIAAYKNLKAALDNAANKKKEYESGNPAYASSFDKNIAAIQVEYDNASVTDGDIVTKIAAVNVEIQKLIKSQTVAGSDITAGLPGADSSTSADGWQLTTSATQHTFHLNTWSKEADASGIKPPFLEYWRNANDAAGLTDATITYAATGLRPNAIYKVTAFMRQFDETKKLGEIQGASLFAGSNSVDACTGTAATFDSKPLKYGTYSVEGSTDAEGNLIFGITISGATFNWIAWKNLTVSYMGTAASKEELTRFNTALAEADAKNAKLGFEAEEFAPYNGVTVYNEAKAVNTESTQSSTYINGLTEALEAWTANEAEVNAVCDGTFKDQPAQATEANVVLPGWHTVSGNTRQMFKGADSKACLKNAKDESGLFVHPGTYQYGTKEGYTMPLKAGKVYVAKAKYCSWVANSNENFTLTILKDGVTVATRSFGANKVSADDADALKSVEMLFKVEEAGNYVLQVGVSGNTFMTDFYVVSAIAEDITLDEKADYTPEMKFANVTLKRNFKQGWNGLVLPFDMTIEDIMAKLGLDAVMQFTGIESNETGTTLKFGEAAEVKAGVPVMVRHMNSESEEQSYTIENVFLPGAQLQPVTFSNDANTVTYSFTGTYGTTELSGTHTPVTVIDGRYFYNYTKDESVNFRGFRAYFQNESTAPESAEARVCAFTFGDDTTTEIISVTELGNDSILEGMTDLLGRKVKNAAKGGVYIKNGRKFLK